MNPQETLSRDQILAALARLDELLRAKGIIGEVCIFGGAAMVLAFDARESTRDVDAIFVPKEDVLNAARKVADEFGFDPDWMNSGVAGFVSPQGQVTSEGMPIFDNLRVMRPTTEYLLAMKCLASRVATLGIRGDRMDVITLLRELCITDAATACDIVAGYYKESQLPPKVRYFIEETIHEMNS